MLVFDRKYFLLTILLFITEVLIARYLHGGIIRPYIGDFLVVILIYCGVMTFLKAPVLKVALGVLLFSFFIEGLQFYNVVGVLGLQHNRVAKTVLGNSFDPIDLLLYTLGIFTVLIFERPWLKSMGKTDIPK